jgi:ABC-2 type transport system permease protein
MNTLFTLLWIELEKLFWRSRSYIAFIAIGIIIGIIEGGLRLEGRQVLDFMIQNLQEAFVLQGNLLNGYLVTYLVLNSLWLHVPILIALVTGDLVAGETQAGTLRLILARPVGRLRLLTAKYLAGLVYTALVVAFLGCTSWGMGRLVFGTGDLIVFYQTINILPEAELPWRFAAAFAYGGISMGVVASLAFFCSTLADQAMGPIITTVAILIGCTIISTIEVGVFRTVQPLLFTTYLSRWQMFFAFEVPQKDIWLSVVVLVCHMVLLFSGAVVVFLRKDFTT